MMGPSSHQGLIKGARGHRRRMAAVFVLVGALAGCGSPASDSVPGSGSRASTVGVGQSSLANNSGTGGEKAKPASDALLSIAKERVGQGDRKAADPATRLTDERDLSVTSNVPEAIAKDLSSPDARVRYRALEYWETKGAQASLDPVFEALDDEDPAIRAKASIIVEQHWTMEQERERG